jgi:hypothetical protein
MAPAIKNAVATPATLGVIAFAASAYAEKMGHDSVGKWRVEKDELCRNGTRWLLLPRLGSRPADLGGWFGQARQPLPVPALVMSPAMA